MPAAAPVTAAPAARSVSSVAPAPREAAPARDAAARRLRLRLLECLARRLRDAKRLTTEEGAERLEHEAGELWGVLCELEG